MINSIMERRVRKDNGYYDLYLEVPESEYFSIYENVTETDARHIVDQFLDYHQDDGRAETVKINYDKSNHSINIRASLSYYGNDHTDFRIRPNYLRD